MGGATREDEDSTMFAYNNGGEPVSLISNIFFSAIGEVGQLTGVELQKLWVGIFMPQDREEGEAKAHTQLRASFHQGGGTVDRGEGPPDRRCSGRRSFHPSFTVSAAAAGNKWGRR